MSACKAPAWCACGDCRFWRTYRYYGPGKRYAPRAHVQAWRTLKRWAHPIVFLINIETGGYDHALGAYSSEARVAGMVLRRLDQIAHVGRALFGRWDTYSGEHAWWERVLYRLKAAVCLVLGWEPCDMRERCECVGITFWNVEEYGTPDGPGGSCEELQVGYGWGNWFAYVELESWP